MADLNQIRAALEAHLTATVGIPPLTLPNQVVDVDPRAAHIRVQFVPISRRPESRGPNPLNRVQGIYSMVVCRPQSEGEGPGLADAQRLIDRFASSTTVSRGGQHVGIEYAEAGLPYPDAPFYCFPVIASWFAYN